MIDLIIMKAKSLILKTFFFNKIFQFIFIFKKPTRNILKIMPENYQIKVENQDVKGRDFILLDTYDDLDLTVGVAYRPDVWDSETPHINYKVINNYARLKLFKTNQPESILQTQYVIANSVAYFNPFSRDANEQYSVQIELLAPHTFSAPSGLLTQQQQSQLQQHPVLQRTELSFYADSAHKHLSANFLYDRKKLSSYQSYDKQQQYQNVYFTLPLFILIVGLLLNSKKVQFYLNTVRVFVQQRGGWTKLVQSFLNPQQATAQDAYSSMQSKSQKSQHHQRSLHKDLSLSDSERSKSRPSATPKTNMSQSVHFVAPAVPVVDDDTELTASTEEDNDFSLTVINPVKRKVKKAH
jgi:hypothetical protein